MTFDTLLDVFSRSVTRLVLFTRKHFVLVAIGAFVLISGAAYLFFANTSGNEEVMTVTRKPFTQQVSVSGKVKPVNDVSLSFEQTGRISAVHVAVGEQVKKGDRLIAISSGTLAAQLAAAKATVTKRRVERANETVSLTEIQSEQDTKVASAYRTLLSSGLSAEAASGSYDVTAPTIIGAYTGPEGQYKLVIDRNIGSVPEFILRVFGLERLDPVDISETTPTPLGKKGLYVTFPEAHANYVNTIWYVTIPNTRSSSYLANFNAYQEALRERDRAIAAAEAQLARRSEAFTIADAELAAAEAEVARLAAEMERYTLKAPFAGVITTVAVEEGDTAELGTHALTLISGDRLEVESYVPEINIARLAVDDPAMVTLDAYGDAIPFAATVIAIDPAETVRDGVSTYRVRLAFNEEDEQIRSGMTANIVITTDERAAVLSVPQGSIVQKDGKTYVAVVDGEDRMLREVVTGPVSSLGEIEIVSGLEEGEVIALTKD